MEMERIRRPYLALALYFAAYMAAFTLLEELVKPRYYIHCGLDDLIPFCKWAVIPYVFWFAWVPFVVIYVLRRDPDRFPRLFWGMVWGCAAALFIYAVLPNGLYLRGRVIGTDLLARTVRYIYRVDTATNVCPSLHVYQSLCVCIALFRSQKNRVWRAAAVIITAAICCSTVLLDQHSVVDVVCGGMLAFGVDAVIAVYCRPRQGCAERDLRHRVPDSHV